MTQKPVSATHSREHVAPDEAGVRPSVLVSHLRSLTDRCAGGELPSDPEVQSGLEAGAAELVQLEVRLRSLREQADGPEYGPAAAALSERVDELRTAVGDLRSASAGPASAGRFDFVLPAERKAKGSRQNY